MAQFAIDWIEGTILERPILDVVQELCKWLGGFQELPGRQNGYNHQAVFPCGARVQWSEDVPRMGVHLIFSASALGAWGVDIRGLIIHLHEMGFRSSRGDYAFDDREGLLDFAVIKQAIVDKTVVSHFQKWEHRESDGGGETITFGKRGGESFVRIYNKAAEQHQPGIWNRCELELRGDRAALAFDLLFLFSYSDWAENVAGWLMATLDFKDASDDSNRSRWESAEWWEKFLGACRKARLTVPQAVKTVEQLRKWLVKQVAPSLLVVGLAFGEDEILRIMGAAVGRLSPKHQVMISTFKGAV